MTVNTQDDRVSYIGNGVVTNFTFDFACPAPGDVAVTITDSSGNVTIPSPSLYTVTLNALIAPNPTPVGGLVVYPTTGSPLPTGSTITIQRILTRVQQTSFGNQSVIYPPIIEQALDYLTMLSQAGNSNVSRAFQVPPTDPVPAFVPPVAQRANQAAGFDSAGNLTAFTPTGTTVPVSAVMQPVVAAATLALARSLMGISVPTLPVTAALSISNANNRQVLNLGGGAFYTVTVLSPSSGFDNTFWTILFNNDTRGKTIAVAGGATFILWPTQWVWIFQDGSGVNWMVTNPGRWQSTTAVNFFVDPLAGSDTNDGLATGVGAFQTIQHAVNIVQQIADGPFVINLANGTHSVGNGVLCNLRVVGGNGYSIVGNVSSPNSVIVQSNGTANSNCITVDSNAVVNLSGFMVNCSGGTNAGASGYTQAAIMAIRGGIANINNVNFGAYANGIHALSVAGGSLNFTGPYHVSGNCFIHLGAANGAEVIYNAGTITIDAAMTCNGAFLYAYIDSSLVTSAISLPSTVNTFVNSSFVTGGGNAYLLNYNSVLNIGSGGTYPNPGAGGSATNGSYPIS